VPAKIIIDADDDDKAEKMSTRETLNPVAIIRFTPATTEGNKDEIMLFNVNQLCQNYEATGN
jgi:hypothetical protein